MFQAFLNWISFPKKEKTSIIEPRIEPTLKQLHTEDSLSGFNKTQLTTLCNERGVKFRSTDRKVEMMMRILAAQAEK
jgi:hypothetical protein